MYRIDKSIEQLKQNVTQEFLEFKSEELSKSKEQIFLDSFKIRFYSDLNAYFNCTNVLDRYFEEDINCLLEYGCELIATLYEHYLYDDTQSIEDWEELEFLVRTLID